MEIASLIHFHGWKCHCFAIGFAFAFAVAFAIGFAVVVAFAFAST